MATIESDSDLSKGLERSIRINFDAGASKNSKFKQAILWLNRTYLKFSMTCAQGFDITYLQPNVDEPKSFSERWNRFRLRKRVARTYLIIMLALIVALTLMTINMYFQYVYDFNNSLISQINQQTKSGGRNLFQIKSQSTSEAVEARAWLKTLGSAHLEWAFVIQVIYIYSGFIAISFVFVGPMWMKFQELDYFSWARWLYDAAGECRKCAKLTLAELAKVERTMILASEIEFDQLDELVAGITDSTHYRPRVDGPHFRDSHQPSRNSEFVRSQIESRNEMMGRKHRELVRQLKIVALAGRLNPLNRTREFLDKLSILMFVSLVLQNLCFQLNTIVVYYILKGEFSKHCRNVEFFSLQDNIQALCLFCIVVICFISVLPTTAFEMTLGCDQLKHINEMRNLLMSTIRSNERTYRRLLAIKTKRDGESLTLPIITTSCRDQLLALTDGSANLVETLELDLLAAYVQYQLFVTEHSLALRPFRFFGIIYLALYLIVPLLIRSHSPYMINEMKLTLAICCITTILPSLIFFLPLCHLHQKCTLTYKLIFSLVAQSAYFSSIPALENGSSLSLTLSLLRRELNEPEKALEKFSCQVFWLKITYATMLRVCYWVLLILAPTLNYAKADDDITSQFLSDPFGVYRRLGRQV